MGSGVMSGGACLSESTIAAFLERCLSSAHRAEVEIHVDQCPSCRQLLAGLSAALPLSSTRANEHTTHPAQPARTGHLLANGTTVGRFVVLGQLGIGGMGVVYTAYDPDLDRNVALKLLHPGAQRAGDARAQLLAEAQAMARISHANVIAIYDVGTFGDHVFAAMELVEGTTLRRWMNQRSRTWREVVDVLLLAGEGLAAAHAAGIVHRDFKPENVLLGDDGRVKVTDFGLARQPSATPGHIAGTPGYLPIEAFGPGGVDHRGDQFSFCVTFHEAVHRSRPFSARTPDELAEEIRRGPVLDRASPRIPRRLSDVLRRGLALVPADRHDSMHALLADVRRAVATRRMHRLVTGAVATLAVAIAAVVNSGQPGAAAARSRCALASQQLRGVWDAARRDAARSAFLRTTTPSGSAAFDGVAATIDRYAADWVAIRTDACEATEVRRRQPAALLELRMACLDRARIQLRALVDALGDADASTVRKASAGAAALPALDACSDPEALQAIVSPPLGPVARAQLSASSSTADDPGRSGSQVDIDDHTGRPDFRLPFPCGEAWQLTRKPDPLHPDGHVDFHAPGEALSAGLAVVVSAPGWVSAVIPDNGEVDIDHGGGWFTTYQHMTDLDVSLHQYVSRDHVIGRVGNVNVKNALGGPGPAHLRYEQWYRPDAGDAGTDRSREHAQSRLFLEGEAFDLGVAGTRIRTSTNHCSDGSPGSAVQYDVPTSATTRSPSRATIEVMARRTDDHALFEHWYNNGWNGSPMPYTIAGRPAVVVFHSELHVIARKSDGALVDVVYSPFTGWKMAHLEGRVSGDPDACVHQWNDRLYVAARGSDGLLYRWWTASGTWTHPVRVGNVDVAGTPALFSHYDALYIVARNNDGSLWSWETDRQRGWAEWQLPGMTSDDPDLGVDPTSGLVNILARGRDDRIYRWQSRQPVRRADHGNAGWDGPELIDADHTMSGVPATTIYHGAMHIFARGRNNTLQHWWKDATWHRESLTGAYTGNFDVFQFGDQLQTIGRGADGKLHSIWYDPLDGVWNVENHDIPVTDR